MTRFFHSLNRCLRVATFRAAFPVWTAIVAIFALPVLLCPSGWAVQVQRFWAHGSFGLLRRIANVRYRVRGLENRPSGPVILAVKHQSAWDTIVFLLDDRPPAFVFKKELLRIPIFGRYCRRTGMVPIDRSGGSSALRRMILEARARLAAGRSLVIFPEGTRVGVDDHCGYQPGVAGLYRQLNVPVVPVALNSGLVWPKSGLIGTGFTVTLEYLEPIPPGLPKKDFVALLEFRIEAATTRLVAEARGEVARVSGMEPVNDGDKLQT
ncbi:MAG: lysophospholipid acyltransferase family protein [Sphingomonadales bacterium]